MIVMKNIKTVNRLFENLDRLMDNYVDLPGTKDAEERFWNYVDSNIMTSEENSERVEFENVLYDVGSFREKQGFLYGFNLAMDLMGKCQE